MKRIFFVFLLVLFWVAELAAADTVKEFPAEKLKKLSVDLQCGGAIEISGTTANKVRVQVIFNETSEKEWDIAYASEGDELTIECQSTVNDHHSPDFRIQVPQKFDLELKTRGGDITVTAVNGSITGRTQGGDLQLSKLQGTLQMKTMGGEIELRDSQVDGDVLTMGGRVTIENVIGDIKGRSMGGNVIYRNVRLREGDSGGKAVRIHTMGGSINVDQAETGADVDTMGGDITIASARDYVNAKTMGGDIVIKAIDGRLKATTMGGDIEARITGGSQGKKDALLTSMSGGITLEVPEALAMEIDIQLTYTKGNQGEYRIQSDFPLQIEEDKEWSQEHGTPRKIIRGRGKTGDGRNKITISTINGDVYLKKSK
jgi:DUF4097 and DUF4098 domain-containing protein YvlB